MSWNYPTWFFSLGRFNPGGPTYYGEVVRLRPEVYLQRTVMGIVSAGATFLLLLIIILPIIKHRLHSLIVAVNSICIGVAISLCIVSPEWLTGSAVIRSPMTYYSPQMYTMRIGIHIGLASTNITLLSLHSGTNTTSDHFFYNERIKEFNPELLEPSMAHAIEEGLPIPLMTVIHFLTSAPLGFNWSQDVMEAGYHCYLALGAALSVWFVAILFIAAIPRYSSYTFIAIGVLMMLTNVIYVHWVQLELLFPLIYLSGQFLELNYGVCFWICWISGVWSVIYGFGLSIYDRLHPDKFLTIFDIDYDQKRALATAHRLNKFPSVQTQESFEMDEQNFVLNN